MSVIGMSDKDKVISVAEDGTPVTAAMVEEWCEAYDKEELPEGYEFDGPIKPGRPNPSDDQEDVKETRKSEPEGFVLTVLGLLRIFDLERASEPQAASDIVFRCLRIAQAETAEATLEDVLAVMSEQPEPMAAELCKRAIANIGKTSERGKPCGQIDGGVFEPSQRFRRWVCSACGAVSFRPDYLGPPNYCQRCGARRVNQQSGIESD